MSVTAAAAVISALAGVVSAGYNWYSGEQSNRLQREQLDLQERNTTRV